MDSIGQRLKDERKRLGYNQTDFAVHGGVQKNAQSNYESDARQPDAAYLAAIAKLGADITYIVTGARSAAALTAEEQVVIAGYRALSDQGRAGVLGLIGGMRSPETEATPTRARMVFNAKVGQVKNVEGDYHQNKPVTFNVSAKSKRGTKPE